MTIVEKIKEKTNDIRKNWCTTGSLEASRLQRLAMAAMREGRQPSTEEDNSAWHTYMEIFADANEPWQLQRLMGEEEEYLTKEWGEPSLAYIVANGMCTEFSFADTTRYMDDEMLNGIVAPPDIPVSPDLENPEQPAQS